MIDRRDFMLKVISLSSIALLPTAFFWPGQALPKELISINSLTKISADYNKFKIFFEDTPFSFEETSFMSSFVDFYLSQNPEIDQPRALIDKIAKRLKQKPPFAAELFSKSIDEDFTADRLVTYRGWIFADMEAQLCALARFSLQANSRA